MLYFNSKRVKGGGKRSAVITMQGHVSGFHNSVGIEIYPEYKAYQQTRGMFAIQAVKEGYIAVAIEQRGEKSNESTGTSW